MAITRVWQSGAETGSALEWTGIQRTPDISSSIKYTGTYSFQAGYNGTLVEYWYQTVPATRQIRAGLFHYMNVLSATVDLIDIRSASASLVKLQWTTTSETLSLWVEGVEKDSITGFSLNTWHHIGIDTKIDSSSGWATVYIDGVSELTASGNTGNSDITTFRAGKCSGTGTTDIDLYHDDLYIDDTTGEGSAAACPLIRLYPLTMDGAGNYTQWDPSAGSNYQCVDEVPVSEADYVETSVVDEYDSYTMTGVTLSSGQTINAVIPTIGGKRGGSTEQIALGTRLSTTDSVGSDQDLGTSLAYIFERQTTKPGGGSWGESDVNGAELVIKSRGSY